MPNIEKAKNHEGKTIFPVTVSDAVLVGNGQTLKGKLSELGQELGYFYSALDYDKLPYIIGQSNRWEDKEGCHILIPIKESDEIVVKSQENYPSVIAFLSSDKIDGYDTNAPIIGERYIIPANTKSDIIIAEKGSLFLYISYISFGLNIVPISIFVNGKDRLIGIDDSIKLIKGQTNGIENTIVKYGDFIEEKGWLNKDKQMDDTGTHICVPVRGNKKLYIIPDTITAFYVFISNAEKPSSGDTLNTIGNIVYVYTGTVGNNLQCHVADIPENATFVVINYNNVNGITYLPSTLFVDSYDILGGIASNIPSRAVDSFGNMQLIWEDDFQYEDKNVWQDVNFSKFLNNERTKSIKDIDGNKVLSIKVIKNDEENIGGYISTGELFAAKYGKIEGRIKLQQDNNLGAWFSFFMFGQSNIWPNSWEYDIFEFFGHNVAQTSIHYNSIEYNKEDNHCECNVFDLTKIDCTQWHIYSVEWNDKYIIFKIDNSITNLIPIERLKPATLPNYPMDIRLNAKAREDVNNVDAEMLVDYVRYYSIHSYSDVAGVTHPDIILNIGDEYTVSPRFIPMSPTNMSFSVESQDNNIVDDYKSEASNLNYISHRIKAISIGKTKITITAPNGKMCTFDVQVKEAT